MRADLLETDFIRVTDPPVFHRHVADGVGSVQQRLQLVFVDVVTFAVKTIIDEDTLHADLLQFRGRSRTLQFIAELIEICAVFLSRINFDVERTALHHDRVSECHAEIHTLDGRIGKRVMRCRKRFHLSFESLDLSLLVKVLLPQGFGGQFVRSGVVDDLHGVS